MACTEPSENFEHDNFFSMEDWGMLNSNEFNNFVQNEISDEKHKEDSESGIHDMFTNFVGSDTVMLTRENEEKHDMFVEQFIEEIHKNSSKEKMFRRLSSNSSSSAYSSHSSTPPAMNEYEGKLMSDLPMDMGFISDVSDQSPDSLGNIYADTYLSSPESLINYADDNLTLLNLNQMVEIENTKKKDLGNFDSLDDDDLAKAVQAACQETNRLLMLHKEKPIEFTETTTVKSKRMKASVDLKSLCDDTILDGVSLQAEKSTKLTRNQFITDKPSTNGTKRKSASRKSGGTKKASYGHKSEAPFSRTSQLNSNTQNSIQIISSRSPQTSSSQMNVMQTSNAPLKIIVKQEPVTTSSFVINGNIATTSHMLMPQNNIGITLGSPNGTIIKTEQSSNPQTIVIHPMNSNPPQPSIDLTNIQPGKSVILSQSDIARLSAQGVIKFPDAQKEQKNIQQQSPLQNQMSNRKSNPVTGKFAVERKKKPLIPADNASNSGLALVSGSSVFVSNGRDAQVGELDIKALKRQQRMIKNRESACQSRQKRKEYMQTLESKAFEFADENKKLVEENGKLKKEVKRLKEENNGLKNMLIATHNKNRNKSVAGLLMLSLFIGLSFGPWNVWHLKQFTRGVDTNSVVAPVAPSSSFARHLLSVSNEYDKETSKSDHDEDDIKISNEDWDTRELSTEVLSKESYWMDDFIRNYKDKHLVRLIELLRNSPNPIQRMLRRKLKEELGLRVPLPKGRRISYDPSKEQSTKPALNEREFTTPKHTKESNVICPHPTMAQIYNETEMSEVSDALTEWAQRHTGQTKKQPAKNKKLNTKSPQSRYKQEPSQTNEIALYGQEDHKFDDFFDAINRKNDTFYVVSLGKDHLLLPAMVRNISSRSKMTLVMPAMTTNGSSSVDYETLIQIECEVLSTNTVRMKQSAIPDALYNKNPAAFGKKPKLKTKSPVKVPTNTTEPFSSQNVLEDDATIMDEP